MKTVVITMLGLIMLSGALAYYPGEVIQEVNEFGIENLVYTIINNLTEVPELDILIDTENITINFPGDMPPNSFDIVFIEEKTNTVVQTIHSGGGGSRTKYVDRNITFEVPKFYDRNVTEYVDKPINISCVDDVEETDNLRLIDILWFSSLFIVALFVSLYYFLKNKYGEFDESD